MKILILTVVLSVTVFFDCAEIDASSSRGYDSPPEESHGGPRPRMTNNPYTYMASTSASGGSGVAGRGVAGGRVAGGRARGRGTSRRRVDVRTRYIPKNPEREFVPHNPVIPGDPKPAVTYLIANRAVGVWKNPQTHEVTWIQPIEGENIVPDPREYKKEHNYMTKLEFMPEGKAVILYLSPQMELLGLTQGFDPAGREPDPKKFFINFNKNVIQVTYDPVSKVIDELEFVPRNDVPGPDAVGRIQHKVEHFHTIAFNVIYEPKDSQGDEHMWSCFITPKGSQLVTFDEWLIPRRVSI